MTYYYSTKVAIIVLAAAIPVMTTINAWPWTIAVVGGLIAVVEGVSQLWHFHERFVTARAVMKGLDRERIRYMEVQQRSMENATISVEINVWRHEFPHY